MTAATTIEQPGMHGSLSIRAYMVYMRKYIHTYMRAYIRKRVRWMPAGTCQADPGWEFA